MILLLVVMGLFVTGVWYVFWDGEEPEPKNNGAKTPTAISTVKTIVQPKPQVVTNEPVVAQKDEWSGGKYPGEKIISCQTNASGFIVEQTVDKMGRKGRHISSPPSPWKHSTDEMLANLLSAPVRGEMAPLPPVTQEEMDREFKKSINTPIAIEPDDDESLKTAKEMVISAREEIKERMENGEHFLDIVADARKLFNENGHIRQNAVQELREILRSGDEESARKYMVRVNAAFSQMGISQISVEETKSHKRKNQTVGCHRSNGIVRICGQCSVVKVCTSASPSQTEADRRAVVA